MSTSFLPPTPPPAAATSAAYQLCRDELMRQAPEIIKRWYTRLAEKLYDLSTAPAVVSEKRELHDAWVALKSSQAAIEQGFTPNLAKIIALDTQVGSSKKADQPALTLSPLRFNDLELMGDAQVQETLNQARLTQVFLLASDAGLTGFAARLSTAQGLKSVKLDKNPFRPEIVSRALLTLLQSLPIEANVRARWLLYGAQLMGNELLTLYRLLSQLLEKQGVQEAPYVVITSPEEPHRAASGSQESALGARPSAGTPPSAARRRGRDVGSDEGGTVGAEEAYSAGASTRLSREQVLTLDHLHRLMVGGYDDAFAVGEEGSAPDVDLDVSAGAASGYPSTEPAALGVLAELTGIRLSGNAPAKPRVQARSSQARSSQAYSLPFSPVAASREQLKQRAKSMGQSLAIEVVSLMIEQLVSDDRLLAPVRQVIAAAEPAFLQLGTSDPRFFSNQAHPARRLLDSITAQALAYADADAPGFADFLQDLQRIGALLVPADGVQAPDFEVLLQQFEDQQAKRNQAAIAAQKLGVQALLQAEQRNLLAEKIAAEIKLRRDFVTVNPIIVSFVTGPWAQVLAKERLMGEHGGIGQRKAVYSLALGDLLWSIDLAQTSSYRKRLVKIIPELVKSLREGLMTINYPLAQAQTFFDELMRLHQEALKPGPSQSAAASKKPDTLRALDEVFAKRDDAGQRQPWLAPDEARESGFMEYDDTPDKSVEPAVPRLKLPDASELLPAGSVTTDGPYELNGMQPGDWAELVSGSQWVRAQLSWISPHNTLFMFTTVDGRSYSMTARVLEQLLAQGRFRIVSQQGVLDGAFDKVARAAMRNSVDVQLD